MVATVGLTIAALPDQRLQEALAQLSVFPCGWEPEGAAAILACHEGRSNVLVQQLYRHGLVLYDSSTARYYLHPGGSRKQPPGCWRCGGTIRALHGVAHG